MEAEATTQIEARSAAGVGATAGTAGICFALGALSLVNLFVPAIPFPPFQLAQALVQATPGPVATAVIENLGPLALPLAVVATAVLFVLAGAACGVLAVRFLRPGARAWVIASGLPWLAWFAAAPSGLRSAHLGGHIAAMLIGWTISAGTGAWVAARIRGGSVAAGSPTPQARTPGADDPTRRYLIRAGAAGVGGLALAMSGLSKVVSPSADPGNRPLAALGVAPSQPSPQASASSAGFSAIKGLSPEITPTADFYTIDEAIVDPNLDPASWSLKVEGLVDRPASLTHDDLLDMRAVERPQTLLCISQPPGGDLISTAVWTGVPMRDLLTRAGADTSALEVVFRSADGYSDSLSFEQCMDPETLLAFGMNGRTLPRAHGFPVRLLSTGTYGMKNPKWITSIEVVDSAYTGFWEERGWAKVAPVKTGARIDTPTGAEQIVAGRTVTVAGVAFAGDRGVSRVEVSADGGANWADAVLKPPLGPFTWVLWRYDWSPSEPGSTLLVARAYDGEGVVQTSEETAAHPAGASGLHELSLEVA